MGREVALHIRSFEVTTETGRWCAALQLFRDNSGVRPRIRITHVKPHGRIERFVGFAVVNRDCELVKRPEEISQGDAEAIEAVLVALLGVD